MRKRAEHRAPCPSARGSRSPANAGQQVHCQLFNTVCTTTRMFTNQGLFTEQFNSTFMDIYSNLTYQKIHSLSFIFLVIYLTTIISLLKTITNHLETVSCNFLPVSCRCLQLALAGNYLSFNVVTYSHQPASHEAENKLVSLNRIYVICNHLLKCHFSST